MASAYFPFSRKQNDKPEQIEKPSTAEPILKDGDEKVLDQHVKNDKPAPEAIFTDPTKITDQGQEKRPSKEDKPIPRDQVVVPEQHPSTREKNKEIELPSQEEAEALTGSFKANLDADPVVTDENKEKKTWIAFLSTFVTSYKRPESADSDSPRPGSQQTWSELATSYLQSLPGFKSSDKAGGKGTDTAGDQEANAKQDREISALLDQLKLSSFNNHLFARGSDELQAVYTQFSQVLKDIINGVPTAYDDLENLMKTAGPQLEARFKDLPPFLRTLVKSLPMKLAPELMAVAGATKPDDDLRTNLANASAPEASASTSFTSKSKTDKEKEKKKRRVPGLKSLVSREGMVATMLRNVVTFLQTRFPFLASTTNIVMSLAVFILMFVFWYCYKRGREVRLEKEAGENADGQDNAEESNSSSGDDSDNMAKSVDQTKTDNTTETPVIPSDTKA